MSPISNDLDLSRIAAHPWLAEVRYFEEITSTNDAALEMAAGSPCKTPLLVLAKRQTRGRGRGNNQWWSGEGSLTFSLLLNDPHIPIPSRDWPRLPLIIGLAVTRALGQFIAADQFQLKWPNDVYLQGRKIGGILVESTSGSAPWLVIGIGLNVNNRLSAAPSDVAGKATSLADARDRSLSLTDVLLATLLQISQTFSALPQHQSQLLKEWRSLCLLTGRQVEVHSGARAVRGMCRGIDDEGALCIETVEGFERCWAGNVTFD